MLKCAEMCLKTMNLGVTFVHRLQKLQVEKADGWEQTKPHKVGNNLPWIDINMKKKKREKGMKIMFSKCIKVLPSPVLCKFGSEIGGGH